MCGCLVLVSRGFSVNNSLPTPFKVKAHGPGLEKTGVAINKPAEFTVDARSGGKAPLKVQVQVRSAMGTGFSTAKRCLPQPGV